MPAGFDWQTEDRNWQDDEPPRRAASRWSFDAAPAAEPIEEPEPDDAPPTTRRRRWPFLLLAGVLALTLVAVLYWQLERRATAAQARLTTDIAASHQTILEAARAGDGELFVSFLSGRDPAWTKAQEHLARNGNFVDRAAFALTWTPGPPVSPTVTLSPDLRAAEMTLPQNYTLDVGNGLTETITLQQTAVYRQGPDRWLYSPPDEEFWGETAVLVYRYLQIAYPARDADVAEPLARDIDAALAELCRGGDGDCAQIDLVLSTDPASLVAYDRAESTWRGGSEIVMPTPTLFGRPADDAATRALSRAYAARVVAAATANLTGWQCCRQRLFYGALLEAQLYRLGLRAWPVDGAVYGQLAQAPEQLRTVEALWRQDEAPVEAGPVVYALIDFLVARNDTAILDMQRLLLSADLPYWVWLTRVTNNAYISQTDFERDLLRHAAERGLDAAALH